MWMGVIFDWEKLSPLPIFFASLRCIDVNGRGVLAHSNKRFVILQLLAIANKTGCYILLVYNICILQYVIS